MSDKTKSLLIERHIEYYMGFIKKKANHLIIRTTKQQYLLERWSIEYKNIQYALSTSINNQSGSVQSGVYMVGMLWSFWQWKSMLSEGWSWITRSLAIWVHNDITRAMVLYSAGEIIMAQGKLLEAEEYLLQSEQILIKQSPSPAIDRLYASVLTKHAWVPLFQGQPMAAQPLLLSAYSKLTSASSMAGQGDLEILNLEFMRTLYALGMAYINRESDATCADPKAEGIAYLQKAIALESSLGAVTNYTYYAQAWIAKAQGNHQESITYFTQGLRQYKLLYDTWGLATLHAGRGHAYMALTPLNAIAAQRDYGLAIAHGHPITHYLVIPGCLEGLAKIAMLYEGKDNDESLRAAWLLGAATAIRDSTKGRLMKLTRDFLETLEADIKERCGAAYQQYFDVGYKAPLEDVIAVARGKKKVGKQ